MYLLSQDKKNLIAFERIGFSKTFGTYTLTAYGKGDVNWVQVGDYNNEEEARAEFNHIIEALKNGQVVYEMR